LTSQVSTFSHTEAELRSQLNIYVEKFKQVLFQPFQGSHSPWIIRCQYLVTNAAQVEDTLNNSNDLFLTFRKEMEEMSKKTKRLEKENHTLNRKHEQTNRNILEMAEERTRNHEELERWRRKCHHLEALCRRMQAQGRGEGLALAEGDDHLEGDDEGTESEYDDDYEDEDEDISDEDDPEPPVHRIDQPSEKPVFGPTPPPNLLEARANGNAVLNGCH
jgi:myosin heavy subunit